MADGGGTTPSAGVRQRLADDLHAGVVQQVTALSLAVDNALLHHADGDAAGVGEALRAVRAIADGAVAECRRLIDGLHDSANP